MIGTRKACKAVQLGYCPYNTDLRDERIKVADLAGMLAAVHSAAAAADPG